MNTCKGVWKTWGGYRVILAVRGNSAAHNGMVVYMGHSDRPTPSGSIAEGVLYWDMEGNSLNYDPDMMSGDRTRFIGHKYLDLQEFISL